MPKDAPHTLDEPPLHTIEFGVLGLEILDDCLSERETLGPFRSEQIHYALPIADYRSDLSIPSDNLTQMGRRRYPVSTTTTSEASAWHRRGES